MGTENARDRGFLQFEERLVSPIEVLLSPERCFVATLHLIYAADCAYLRVCEALYQQPQGIALEHGGGVGENHDVAAQLWDSVVQYRDLPAVLRVCDHSNAVALGYLRSSVRRSIRS